MSRILYFHSVYKVPLTQQSFAIHLLYCKELGVTFMTKISTKEVFEKLIKFNINKKLDNDIPFVNI